MTQSHAISALVAKRAELSGKSLDQDRQKAELKAQISHIDHTLAIFGYRDPPRDIKPVRPVVYRFERRELPLFLMDMQREGMKLSNRDAALRLIAAKGWDAADLDLVRKVTESVKSAKNWQGRKTLLSS
jgi:hypothetical protein